MAKLLSLFQKAIQRTHLLMRLLQLDDMYLIMHVKEISLQVLWLNSSMIWPEIKMNILQQTQKSICTNLLMNTAKRDVLVLKLLLNSLFRCSHKFQCVNLTGSRTPGYLEKKALLLVNIHLLINTSTSKDRIMIRALGIIS